MLHTLHIVEEVGIKEWKRYGMSFIDHSQLPTVTYTGGVASHFAHGNVAVAASKTTITLALERPVLASAVSTVLPSLALGAVGAEPARVTPSKRELLLRTLQTTQYVLTASK